MSYTVLKVGWRLRKQRRPRSRNRLDIIATLAERHGWVCWLCGGEIDPALARGNQWAATLDHIDPVSAGGTNALSNLRLAHRRCNTMRGNKPLDRSRLTT